jgi:hypothetical protein
VTEIVILGTKGFSQHQKPLLDYFKERITVESDYRPSAIAAHDPDLVISFEASNCQRGLCIAETARNQVASLQIMDGITEWRNTWTRRVLPFQRPLNQPVLAHKVACLGAADARLFEAWGNVGKCEIIGMPRIDSLIQLGKSMRLEPVTDRPLRLLVMTARTPGFTPQEVETTLQSLRDLRDHLAKRDDVQVIWRITKGLHKELQVQNTFRDPSGQELHEILAQVDAVITTPSTAMLEGMLYGLPVALLDYHNCPLYVHAAWRITSREHIEPTLEDLATVPLERMLYQDFCLHDALSCRTPALPRLIKLIEEMIRIKRECHAEQKELTFPHRIINEPELLVAWPSESFSMEALYPNHPVFGQRDLCQLQAELDAALGSIEQVKEQVDILTRRLHKIPGYKLAAEVQLRLKKLHPG